MGASSARGAARLMAHESDLFSAARLAHQLRSGGSMPNVQVPFRLDSLSCETAHAAVACQYAAYTTEEVGYETRSGRYGFGADPLNMAAWVASKTTASVGNGVRRAMAARRAAAQWRADATGTVYLTNARLVFIDETGFYQWDYADFLSLDPTPEGVVFHATGMPPQRFGVPCPKYLYTAMLWLGYLELPTWTLDSLTIARAGAHGYGDLVPTAPTSHEA